MKPHWHTSQRHHTSKKGSITSTVLDDVVVSGRAGATGDDGVVGVDVLVWDVDGWRKRQDAGEGDANTLGEVSAVVTVDTDAPIAVALMPRSGTRLVVDSYQLELRYRRLVQP